MMTDKKTVIGTLDTNKPTTIWGAGFSGLVLAYYLQKNGHDVTIKEISNRAGGKISTTLHQHHVVEHAANALFLDHNGYQLVKDLGLLDQLQIPPAGLKRFIYHSGELHSVFSQIPLLKLLKNFTRTTPTFSETLSLSDFFIPWLGDRTINNLMNPAMGGIYATSCEHILLSTLFPFNKNNYPTTYWKFFLHLRAQKKTKLSSPIKGTVSFEKGMTTLINTLASKLEGKIHYNCEEKPNWEKENNIICTDALNASKILAHEPQISSLLQQLTYGPLSSHTLLMSQEISSLKNAFGVLLRQDKEQDEKAKSTPLFGVLANHNLFKKNYPQFSSYTLISPAIDSSIEGLSKKLITLAPAFSLNNLKHSSSFRWEQGLPLYDENRFRIIKDLKIHFAKKTGICLFGNYVAGISMREMIQAALNFSKENKK